MIDIQPFIVKLDLLAEYMKYWIDTTPMSMSHKFATYPEIARSYFVDGFTKCGWTIEENRMYIRRKTFDEWLAEKTNLCNSKNPQ